jgi:TPR repeat protein
MATGFAPNHPSRVLPRSRHPLPTPDPGYNPILPIGGEKERVLMRFLADQPYASRGECPPSPPRSLLAEIAASDQTGGGRDWWGTPDDGTGPSIAGETWCGECLVVVGAGAQRCAYQWQRAAPGGVPESIPDARGPRYVVTEDDLGCRLRCVVSRPRMRRAGAPDKPIGADDATLIANVDDVPGTDDDDDDDDEVRVACSESVATHAPYHYANGGPTGANDVVSHADDGLHGARSPGAAPVQPGRVGDKGHARSDYRVGQTSDKGGDDAHHRREIVLRPPRGGANHAVDATFALGTQREGEGREMARVGDAVGANEKFAGAERCYRVAADAGHVLAKCRLGRMIEQGWGRRPPDPSEAAALYRAAADEGCAEGENNLGALLYLGVTGNDPEHPGTKTNDPEGDAAEAAALFHRARSRGHAAACSNLALCYEEGRGVAGGRDLKRAGALYLEAARAGVVDAYAGAGVVAMMRGDLREAMAAFRAGATQGGGDATERLRALAMRRRDGRAAMATERGGTDLIVTMRSEPDTSRAPSMQASDDLPDDTDEAGWVNDGGSRRDAHAGGRGWTAGWDADHHAERYESEIARYYRLSRDLYDAMVGSGDPAMARAAEEAVHEAFPEMRAHH